MSAVLSVSDLSIVMGERTLVDGVSFELAAGETLALVGESGSGKSLTALAVQRLLPKAMDVRGGVALGKEELHGLDERGWQKIRGCRIGMIFQEPLTALNPLHTIGKQLAEMVTLHHPLVTGEQVKARVSELLHQVGLERLVERLGAYPHELSGGQRQRVMIAMAIANNPELLIADEPTTALDVTVQKQILELLQRLQKERGMALLFITHDLTLVKRYADRVAVMQQGRIVEMGKVAAVLAKPKHAYTKFLIEAAPKGENRHVPDREVRVLEAEKVVVKFPAQTGFWGKVKAWNVAVEEASLTLDAGETLGIVGESGSGKTTLALALLKLVPSAGRIVVLGERLDELDSAKLRALRQKMQLVFQDPFSSLSPRMTVGDIIAEGLRVYQPGLSAAVVGERVAKALAEVGLPGDAAPRYPHEFSGGQRQRIAIARALIVEPQLLVLDEPTSALDLATQAQILDLLRKLQAERQLSYLFISHDLRVIKAIAHRIIVLKQGKIVEQKEAGALFRQPEHPYTQALLEAAMI